MGSLDYLVTTIGTTLEEMAFNSLRTYLTANAPWTNLPIIKTIIDIFLNKALNILFTKTEYGVYVLGVVQIVNEQNDNFKKAVDTGDKDKIIQAARDLIKLKSP